jgi:hypothetical protein
MTLKRIIVIVAAIVGLWIAGSLALHFGQIHHDYLGYNIDEHFPPGKPTVPGEIFASTLAAIVEHELHTGFGWRPNDFFLWGPKVAADNNSDRQLGIILAVRETTRVFKDHLTKVSSNQYDQNLVIADTDFRDAADFARAEPARGRADPAVPDLDRHPRRRACKSLPRHQGRRNPGP